MDRPRLLKVSRANWLFVLLPAILAGAAAVALTMTQARAYEASAQLFVSTGNEPTSTSAEPGLQFSQSQIPSYAVLIASEESAAKALKSIGSDDPPADLASRIRVSFVPETVVLNISITDAEPQRAAVLANAIANGFEDLVTEVDSPGDPFQNLTRVSIVSYAEPPSAPLPLHVVRNGMLGVLLGLTIGISIVLIRRRLDGVFDEGGDYVRDGDIAGHREEERHEAEHHHVEEHAPEAAGTNNRVATVGAIAAHYDLPAGLHRGGGSD